MGLYAARRMFPDLTADDIFRLETKRLWLRWPRASDARHITCFASLAVTARMTAAIPHPYPAGEAEKFIFQSRADNANGQSLVLAIAQKRAAHAIGVISVSESDRGDLELGYLLAPGSWGKGLATEAATALVDAVFCLTPATSIFANARVINIASRRVLEKCGFVYIDTGLDVLPARGGLHPCDRFLLERRDWAKRRGARSMPPMHHQPVDSFGLGTFATRSGG
jgi:RimJ/RimL family protein N-acetyltransferase